MIPPDVANNLRLVLPDQGRIAAGQPQNQPVASVQRITDILGTLQPGQRLLAEIQALLPNGSYRAIVAQREITLALPFSAKAGDSLELEVLESDGNVALAFVANRSTAVDAEKAADSVATRFSQTGRLIGDLLAEIDNQGKRAPPAPLNGNQPLAEMPPRSGAELAPLLKQALTQSGMFYEAHQARWLSGEISTRQLLQEPQGRLSQLIAAILPEGALPRSVAAAGAEAAAPGTASPGLAGSSGNPPAPGTSEAGTQPTSASATQTPHAAAGVEQGMRQAPSLSGETLAGEASQLSSRPNPAMPSAQGLPRELAPLVQQQLDGLATQSFAWQGQVWPGQSLFWEIEPEPDGGRAGAEEDGTVAWRTRLKLSLPQLGGIEASLQLRPGRGIEIVLTADSIRGAARLQGDASELQTRFAAADLPLGALHIDHGPSAQ